jgi:hypothetical protein
MNSTNYTNSTNSTENDWTWEDEIKHIMEGEEIEE